MPQGSCVVLIAVAASVCLGCAAPLHPSNPAAIGQICESLCARRHGCDVSDDYGSCVSHCTNYGSPRRVYFRQDVIDSVRACVARTTCGPDLQRRLTAACFRDVYAAVAATPLAGKFCERQARKDFVCGVRSTTVDKCLEGTKLYTDAILQQLDDCLGEASCRTYGRCQLGVVGPDEYWNRDRDEQWRARPVATAPSPTIRFSATVLLEGRIPIAGATVCVADRPDLGCAVTDANGRVDLTLPANQELAITVNAPGSVPQLVPFRTGTRDVNRWTFNTQRVETLKERFAALDAGDPGAETTSVAVYAHTPDGRGGFERLQITLAPASGAGPFYLQTNGAPSRTRRFTSLGGAALFVNVTPGIVQVEVAPDGVNCVLSGAGWAAPRVNQVRAPVRAGYETRVTLSCHW